MAQRKITAAVDAKELPDLTAQQLAFVEGILEGKTATTAYREAYDCSSMASRTIWAEASRLRSNPSVTAWVEASKMAGLGSTRITYERHINELERLKVLCEKSGNMGAALGCEQTIGKAAGLHIDRVQEVPHDPVQTLRDIAQQHGDELAQQLAASAGIEWNAPADTTKH